MGLHPADHRVRGRMQVEFQAGAIVRARCGRYSVLSADTIAQASGEPVRRLRLRALDDPFRNEEICVLYPIENVEPDEIPELNLSNPGRIARFQLLMDAVRLSLAPGAMTEKRQSFELSLLISGGAPSQICN